MHSKALVEMHLFSNIAELLDTLRLNQEIAGNVQRRGRATRHNVQTRGGNVQNDVAHKGYHVHII